MAIRPAIGYFAAPDRGVVAPTDALGCPKLAGTSATPTAAITGVTGATITVTGNDLAYLMTIVLPVIALSLSATITLTYSSAWPVAPIAQPSNQGANPFNILTTGNISTTSTTTASVFTLTLPILSSASTLRIGVQAMC